MKKVYTDYCINHDKAEQLLEKYEAKLDVQTMLRKSVKTFQATLFEIFIFVQKFNFDFPKNC